MQQNGAYRNMIQSKRPKAPPPPQRDLHQKGLSLQSNLPPKPKKPPPPVPERGAGSLQLALEKSATVPGESKYRRAAKFMVLIGSDEASKILSRLDSAQVDAISREVVNIRSIGPFEAESILEEFKALLSSGYGYSGSSSGGIDEARRMLYAAFGPDKGEAMLLKAVPEAVENPFDFLNDFSGAELAILFAGESPAVSAMVLSRLPAQLAAGVLREIDGDRKLEIVKRIARLNDTPPDIIDRVAAALKDKARHFSRGESGEAAFAGGETDGRQVLAAILRHSGEALGGRLLDELEEGDPALGRQMKERLYTLEDVCNAADRPIMEKLRTMEDRDIVYLVRGREKVFVQKILGNLSAMRRKRVLEESDIMGPVPKIEVEAAAREFLSWFMASRKEGHILMLSGEDVLL
jgi:flagellar motor switch protein FliG